jgi:hypothetical protein
MQVKELTTYINAIQDDIAFLQREIKNIKLDQEKKLKSMETGLNRFREEQSGLYKLQNPKTKVKPDIEGYVVEKIKMLPQFREGIKKLESGENVDITLGVKMKSKELPLQLRKEPGGSYTKEFESDLKDADLEERVEERLKTKEFVKDKDGIHYE